MSKLQAQAFRPGIIRRKRALKASATPPRGWFSEKEHVGNSTVFLTRASDPSGFQSPNITFVEDDPLALENVGTSYNVVILNANPRLSAALVSIVRPSVAPFRA